MPSLTYQVPNSIWARYERKARRDGVPVRTWILWKLNQLAAIAAAEPDDDEPTSGEQPQLETVS